MKRKAQAALEFLTTYGWAFLVILIMIGALAYFGVLNPSNLVPDKCIASGGFTCQESQILSPVATIRLKNGLEATNVVIESVSVSGSACTTATTFRINNVATAQLVQAGEVFNVTFTCSGLVASERPTFVVTMNSTPVGKTLVQQATIELSSRVR
jgi:hypothetical protein